MAGRKAKYSVNALKEDLVEAEEDVNNDHLVASSESLKDTNSIGQLNDGDKLAQLNLLDVAVTKPLKGKQAREFRRLCLPVSTSADNIDTQSWRSTKSSINLRALSLPLTNWCSVQTMIAIGRRLTESAILLAK